MALADACFVILKNAVSEVFLIAAATLTPQTTAADVPGWDSVSQVMLVLRLEDDLSIELNVNDINEAQDLGTLARILEEKSGK